MKYFDVENKLNLFNNIYETIHRILRFWLRTKLNRRFIRRYMSHNSIVKHWYFLIKKGMLAEMKFLRAIKYFSVSNKLAWDKNWKFLGWKIKLLKITSTSVTSWKYAPLRRIFSPNPPELQALSSRLAKCGRWRKRWIPEWPEQPNLWSKNITPIITLYNYSNYYNNYYNFRQKNKQRLVGLYQVLRIHMTYTSDSDV